MATRVEELRESLAAAREEAEALRRLRRAIDTVSATRFRPVPRVAWASGRDGRGVVGAGVLVDDRHRELGGLDGVRAGEAARRLGSARAHHASVALPGDIDFRAPARPPVAASRGSHRVQSTQLDRSQQRSKLGSRQSQGELPITRKADLAADAHVAVGRAAASAVASLRADRRSLVAATSTITSGIGSSPAVRVVVPSVEAVDPVLPATTRAAADGRQPAPTADTVAPHRGGRRVDSIWLDEWSPQHQRSRPSPRQRSSEEPGNGVTPAAHEARVRAEPRGGATGADGVGRASRIGSGHAQGHIKAESAAPRGGWHGADDAWLSRADPNDEWLLPSPSPEQRVTSGQRVAPDQRQKPVHSPTRTARATKAREASLSVQPAVAVNLDPEPPSELERHLQHRRALARERRRLRRAGHPDFSASPRPPVRGLPDDEVDAGFITQTPPPSAAPSKDDGDVDDIVAVLDDIRGALAALNAYGKAPAV